MYTIYSSRDKKEFEFEEQHETLPEAIICVGKWLAVRAMNIDPNLDQEEDSPEIGIDEHWFVFDGKDNIRGKLVGSVSIKVKRH